MGISRIVSLVGGQHERDQSNQHEQDLAGSIATTSLGPLAVHRHELTKGKIELLSCQTSNASKGSKSDNAKTDLPYQLATPHKVFTLALLN